MTGRRKRAHSVGDQHKLKSLRSLLSPTVTDDEIIKNNSANSANIDSDINTVDLTQQESLSQSQSQQENISGALSSQSADVIAESLSTVFDASNLNVVRTEISNLVRTVLVLKETVRKQQISIDELNSIVNTRSNDFSNVVELQSAETHLPQTTPSGVTANATSYAAAASIPVLQGLSSKSALNESMRRAVLTAVHTEMKTKEARERNIVITGLHRSNTVQDRDLVSKLLFEEFGMDVSIVQCKRLGKSSTTSDGRPQPLRVVFQSASIAKDVVASAKFLRRSADEYIRGNVFINADLTRAEAEAAYHARCERRRLHQLKPNSKPASSEPVVVSQQQQLASLVTSSALSSLPTNVCNQSTSDNTGSSTDGSFSSRCVTVTADVHQPMTVCQVLPDSIQSGGFQPGSFRVPPPPILMQQGLATGSVSLPPNLPTCSNPQFIPPLHLTSPASLPIFQPLTNPNNNPIMQSHYQSGLPLSQA